MVQILLETVSVIVTSHMSAYSHSPMRVGAVGRVSTASFGGWLPVSSETPLRLDVGTFLYSEKKPSSDFGENIDELKICMSNIYRTILYL
jgi:hypothetical protein